MASRQLPEHIQAILRSLKIEGDLVRIQGQLDRPDYLAVDKILRDLGGKWDRRRGGHVFSSDPAGRLATIVGSGKWESEKTKLAFFPTPFEVASRVAAMADLRPGLRLLEPSAGHGALIEAAVAKAKPGYVLAIDISPENAAYLREHFPSIVVNEGDFLTMPVTDHFDRIIMNPPFTRGADARHVLRAYEWLAPGGKLVAVVSRGSPRRIDEASRQVDMLIKSEQDLPSGSFKQEGTSVETSVIVMEKPKASRSSTPPRSQKPEKPSTEGFPIGAKVLVDGVDLATVRAYHPNGCVNYDFPHYHVDLVGGDTNVAVHVDTIGISSRPGALVRINDPDSDIRGVESVSEGSAKLLADATKAGQWVYLVATQGKGKELIAKSRVREPPVAAPGEVIVTFTPEAYHAAMVANGYRLQPEAPAGVLPPPAKSFKSQGGRSFTVSPGSHFERFKGDTVWHDEWPILHKGKPAGKLFRSLTYGLTEQGEPRWHASVSGLRWMGDGVPDRIGYDVAAFDTFKDAFEAWGHSADQILDWREGKGKSAAAAKPSPRPRASKSPPSRAKRARPSTKKQESAEALDLSPVAKRLDMELRAIFPELYAVATVVGPAGPEQYVQASVSRSPRSGGRKAAKQAPRFFVVIQLARKGGASGGTGARASPRWLPASRGH